MTEFARPVGASPRPGSLRGRWTHTPKSSGPLARGGVCSPGRDGGSDRRAGDRVEARGNQPDDAGPAGHDGAIIGRVFESVTFGTPAELSMARFPDSRVECEFAFRMRDAIPPRARPWSAGELAERAVLHVAVEIIGNRYPKGAGAFKPATNDEIADNGAGIGFVFGPAVAHWRRHDLRNLRIDIRVDDCEPAENFLGECRCDPIDALVQAAGILGERGIAIEAGQYVSTGAATDPQPVRAGSVVRARFGQLGAIDIEFID